LTKPVILIAAGGTGGHMFPAKAFADEMVKQGCEIVLITDPRGKKYTEGFPTIDTLILPVTNAEEGGLMGKIKGGLSLLDAVNKTSPFIKNHNPAAIVGFGGYPTAPALYCAKCPIIIHEQNGVLGRVNKFFQNKATKIFSGFKDLDGLKDKSKQVFVGNPIRAELVALRDLPYPELVPQGEIRLLITGGSQGARALGQAMALAICELDENLRQRLYISHQVREEQCDEVRELYLNAGIHAEVWPFFKDMAARFAKAHLVIGRAGASSVSEAAMVGRPAIFVPLPSAMNDHQTYNARAVEATGGADVIFESELSIANIKDLLDERLNRPNQLIERAQEIKAAANPNAANQMAQQILEIIGAKNA
jgi:UDP-N-acetylglucosamine--N-acetylmuramyl-(pentapeptide) pyrophosphoryl-undecaprenol N-acetylglucosamine transferase